MKKKILIADDAETVLLTAASLLEGKGYEVTAVSDGEKAQEAIAAEVPDFVIADILMPRMGGLDLCRQLKSTNRTKHIKVIIISGDVNEIDKGFANGADDCFVKPFDWDEVLDRLNYLACN